MEWLLPYTIMLEIYKDYIVNNCSKALLQTANEQLSQMTNEFILVTNANEKSSRLRDPLDNPLCCLSNKIHNINAMKTRSCRVLSPEGSHH